MKYYTVKGPIHDYFNTLLSMKKRIDTVNASSSASIGFGHKVNSLAKRLHPDSQELFVSQIINLSENAKCYTLRRVNNLPVAYFRAGQYISLTLKIGESVVSRPFSIASSPANALRGEYRIIVRDSGKNGVSSFILNNWKEGTEVTATAPEGKLYYEPIRDAHRVLAIASPDGIGAVLALAKAVSDGTEDAILTVLYCGKSADELICKDELDRLVKISGQRIAVEYILTDKKQKGYIKARINSEFISKYLPDNEPCSVFISSHNELYYELKKETENLSLLKKYIRFEDYGEPDISAVAYLSENIKHKVFNCTFFLKDEPEICFECCGDETLLSAMEKAGIKIPNHCRSGECGFCRTKLVEGDVVVAPDNDARRIADKKFGYIHPCASYPVSDVVLKL